MKLTNLPQNKIKDFSLDDLGVSFWQIEASPDWFLHWHDYFTIDVILDGEAIHYTPLSRHIIKKGYMHLVMPSDIHYIGSLEGCSIATVRFALNLMPESVTKLIKTQNKSADLDNASLEAVMGIISAMSIYRDDRLLSVRFLEALLLILQNNLTEEQSAVPNNIKKVLEYLDVHFQENVSLENAAAIVSYNPSYFSAMFKKTTGYTYTKYLNSKRLNYACALMKNKDITLTNIALSSGFNSFVSFNRVFKSVIGMTPNEYRARLLDS